VRCNHIGRLRRPRPYGSWTGSQPPWGFRHAGVRWCFRTAGPLGSVAPEFRRTRLRWWTFQLFQSFARRRWRVLRRVSRYARTIAMYRDSSHSDSHSRGFRPMPRTQVVRRSNPAAAAQPSRICRRLATSMAVLSHSFSRSRARRNYTVPRSRQSDPQISTLADLDKAAARARSAHRGCGDFTARPVLASYYSEIINGATYGLTCPFMPSNCI